MLPKVIGRCKASMWKAPWIILSKKRKLKKRHHSILKWPKFRTPSQTNACKDVNNRNSHLLSVAYEPNGLPSYFPLL